jgi:CRP-like cAMP-binding protein
MSVTAKAVLRENLLLRGLTEATLDRVAALAVRRNFPKGAIVFQQGDIADALYAVIAGQIRISSMSAAGQEVFLNILESGDVFGEIAVIDGGERTATAVALGEAALFLIRRADLLALLAREPELSLHLLRVFCQRLRWTSEIIEESAFLDFPARLASRLLRLGERAGSVDGDAVVLRLSQGELAGFLSASRQVVNQYLQEWRARGWITLARGTVVIRDAEALRALSRAGVPAPD